MPDRSKLPKWAQQEIKTLEMRVEEWQAKATFGPENSDTFVKNVGEGDDQPLGRERTIRFQLGDQWWEYIDVRKQDKHVQVFGNSLIKVVPWATNHVRIELEDRRAQA